MSAQRTAAERRAAWRLVGEIAPINGIYYRDLDMVLAPYVTVGARPNLATPEHHD